MKILKVPFGFVYGVVFVGNGIPFVYVEWSYLRQSFLQLFNPNLHLQVVVTLLTLPLLWILCTERRPEAH